MKEGEKERETEAGGAQGMVQKNISTTTQQTKHTSEQRKKDNAE